MQVFYSNPITKLTIISPILCEHKNQTVAFQ